MWAIVSSTKEIERLMSGGYAVNEGTNRALVAQLRQQIMDLTTFTSQLRFKFPSYVNEALARAQSE
jgi:nuclear pore complex protein Nup93